jgi:hypothetical protein
MRPSGRARVDVGFPTTRPHAHDLVCQSYLRETARGGNRKGNRAQRGVFPSLYTTTADLIGTKSTDRSELQNLLTFCRLNKGRVLFVVVFT